MAEMTTGELTGAIKALEKLGGLAGWLDVEGASKRMARDLLLKDYRAKLAAQPPAVDRERRLREALEAAEKYIPEMTVRAVAVTGSDKPEYEESPHPVKAMVRAALADQPPPDPREAALVGAEAELDLMWKTTLELEQEHVGSEYEDEPNYCDQGDDCAKCAIYAHFNNVLEYIRAARGKA